LPTYWQVFGLTQVLMKPSDILVFWSLSGVCLHLESALESLLVGCLVLKLLNLDLLGVSSLLERSWCCLELSSLIPSPLLINQFLTAQRKRVVSLGP